MKIEAGSGMRAVVVEKFGADPVLRTIARPEPGPGEVLVRVAASGVNPLDAKIAGGAAAHAQVEVPAVLGIDLAGEVAGLGAGVTGLGVGQRVYGLAGGVGEMPGSLAEYVVADANLLAPAPGSLTAAEAAALPLAAITAWEALVERAGVGPGDTVLVHGGAGGVGHLAVQLAVARGARVFATGTGASLPTIRALGAEAIDYAHTAVADYVESATGGRGFDVILDTVGGPVLDASFTAVRRYTGRVVSILGWGTHSLAPLSFRGASYSGVFTLLPLLTGEDRARQGAILRQIADLVDSGALRPLLDPQIHALTDVAAAHDRVVAGAVSGKVVVRVSE